MPDGTRREQDLIEKIRALPEDNLAEVDDLVDFLRQREEERRLAQAVTGASEAAFAKGHAVRRSRGRRIAEIVNLDP